MTFWVTGEGKKGKTAMRLLNENTLREMNAFVLYLYFQEYENIENQPSVVLRMLRLLEQYRRPKKFRDMPLHLQPRLQWKYIIVGDSMIMITHSQKIPAMEYVVRDVLNLEIEMANCGLLVHGGLERGSVCWLDEHSLSGQGILRAGELARRRPLYPRIVFKDVLYTPGLLENRLVCRTSDPSIHFLNYLYPHRFIRANRNYVQFMRQIQTLIWRGLDKYHYQANEYAPMELSNYLWLKKYFQRNLRYLPPEIVRELSL